MASRSQNVKPHKYHYASCCVTWVQKCFESSITLTSRKQTFGGIVLENVQQLIQNTRNAFNGDQTSFEIFSRSKIFPHYFALASGHAS